MSRSVPLCLLFVLVPFFTARYATAQPPGGLAPSGDVRHRDGADGGSVEEARNQYDHAQRQVADLARQLAADPSPEDRQPLIDKLRPVVQQSFEARQRLQRAEVAELRRKIRFIEDAIELREKHKDAVIDERVQELLTGKPDITRRDDAKAGRSTLSRDVIDDSARDEFDSQTRERLAQLDLQAAEADLSDAQKELKRALSHYETGAATESAVRTLQKKVREAQLGVERAKIKLEAIAKQRAERAPVVAPRQDGTDRPPTTAEEARRPSSDDFDLDTRERLAEVEVREADAKSKVAQYEYRAHFEANQKAPGSTPKAEMKKLELEWQLAEVKKERADVILAGLRGQRADLEAAADIAVAEAEAEVQKAKAAIEVQAAVHQSFQAQSQTVAADVTAAEANHQYRKKQYERMKGLFEQNSVEERLLDEAEEQLKAATASLEAAQAVVAGAASNVARGDAARVELAADLRIAEARLRAAQQRRDRFVHRDAADQKGGQSAPSSEPGKDVAPTKPE